MLAVFTSPCRYTQGKDATESLGREMQKLGLGGPALVVAGKSAQRLLTAAWTRSLGEAGIAFEVHPFGGECSLPEIERVKSAAATANQRSHRMSRTEYETSSRILEACTSTSAG